MKKNLIVLGSIIAFSSPCITVISCDSEETSKEKAQKDVDNTLKLFQNANLSVVTNKEVKN